MKLLQAIESLGSKAALKVAKEFSSELNLAWDKDVKFVFSILLNDADRVPGNISGTTSQLAIKKWLEKYKGSYENRASQRISNPPGTVADPIIERIIGARLEHLSDDDLINLTYAHRLGMSAENILGLLLEEYLSTRLIKYGWHCAWGETVKSVDFVNEQGVLLQIKNRSNSENSSSSAVRDGTEIEKWFRIKADRVEYMWDKLNTICNTKHLSEDDFVSFAMQCVKHNPSCLAIEPNNPWAATE